MSEILRLEKQPAELLIRNIDFTDRLATGVALTSSTATVVDEITGIDVTSTFLASGTGTVSSPHAQYTFAKNQGVAGRRYLMKALGVFDNTEESEVDVIISVVEHASGRGL